MENIIGFINWILTTAPSKYCSYSIVILKLHNTFMNAPPCKTSKLIVNVTPYLSADGVLGFDGVPDRLAGDLNLEQVQAKDKLMVG